MRDLMYANRISYDRSRQRPLRLQTAAAAESSSAGGVPWRPRLAALSRRRAPTALPKTPLSNHDWTDFIGPLGVVGREPLAAAGRGQPSPIVTAENTHVPPPFGLEVKTVFSGHVKTLALPIQMIQTSKLARQRIATGPRARCRSRRCCPWRLGSPRSRWSSSPPSSGSSPSTHFQHLRSSNAK